jgi:carbon-monoxide dehydrogenase small subunit
MMMTAVQLLERNQAPTRDEIRHALDGNLCRCTGYTHIIDAVEYAAKKGRQ